MNKNVKEKLKCQKDNLVLVVKALYTNFSQNFIKSELEYN